MIALPANATEPAIARVTPPAAWRGAGTTEVSIAGMPTMPRNHPFVSRFTEVQVRDTAPPRLASAIRCGDSMADDPYDPFEEFNRAHALGRVRDPYPRLAELRGKGSVHKLSLQEIMGEPPRPG